MLESNTDLFGNSVVESISPLYDKYIIPPFSILDSRSGVWQDRKREWIALGIKSELGRGDNLTFNGPAAYMDYYRLKEGKVAKSNIQSTSIFDPVLTEIMYSWFCPKDGLILDPFSGGSVRGIVASILGRNYYGIDLNSNQIAENILQADKICKGKVPKWIHGDSQFELDSAPFSDFLFSCPPYGDLEKYTDNKQDLSNMTEEEFLISYRRIISKSIEKLKPDSFACFVVGDYRKKTGEYCNFVGNTISAFLDAGCKLYNEAILVNNVGTAAMRASKQFDAGKKLCKTHQNVLIFIKGDWKKAVKKI